ncbi:MAG TPA: hypothetical protein VEZ44_05795, partial [bacterium]|nr:hypothetical protein [bacterium]
MAVPSPEDPFARLPGPVFLGAERRWGAVSLLSKVRGAPVLARARADVAVQGVVLFARRGHGGRDAAPRGPRAAAR